MASIEFNVAKGRTVELYNRVQTNDPATAGLVIVLLKTAEADATLKDYATLAALLAGTNAEADFTNYARKVLTDADISAFTTDNANDWNVIDIPDQLWTAAGGTTDNTLAAYLVCYAPDTGGADSTFVPLLKFDFVKTTTGEDLPAVVSPDGLHRAP